jgi:hypothetical protein
VRSSDLTSMLLLSHLSAVCAAATRKVKEIVRTCPFGVGHFSMKDGCNKCDDCHRCIYYLQKNDENENFILLNVYRFFCIKFKFELLIFLYYSNNIFQMATKDQRLPSKATVKKLGSSNDEYKNINLNKNHQSPTLNIVQSNSNSSNNEKKN